MVASALAQREKDAQQARSCCAERVCPRRCNRVSGRIFVVGVVGSVKKT
jgi:hypothetical protein